MKKLLFGVWLFWVLGAQAVTVSPNGVGEVIVVPYFTAKDGKNTYVTISNTTDITKAIKVRFVGGDLNFPLRTFNLFLSAKDTFAFATGLVDVDPLSGSSQEGGIYFSDDSCVLGTQSGEAFDNEFQALVSYHLDTEEGSIELYEMGGISNGWTPCDSEAVQFNQQPQSLTEANQLRPPEGGLKATASIIDVVNGYQFSYEPVAFNDFYPNDDSRDYYSLPLVDAPTLADAGVVSAGITFDSGLEAFAAAIMSSQLSNDFNVEPATAAQTEWVMNIPLALSGLNGCHRASVARLYDRKGRVLALVDGPLDDDSAPPNTELDLCPGINVMRFGELSRPSILNSIHETDFSSAFELIPGEALVHGQLELDFADQNNPRLFTIRGDSASGMVSFTGAPVLGFAVQKINNGGARPGLLAAYATAYGHTQKTQQEDMR